MAQEPEQADAAENIVQFTDVRRRRKSTVRRWLRVFAVVPVTLCIVCDS